MTLTELRDWRDYHKWRSTDIECPPEKKRFHRQAVKDLTARMHGIKLLKKGKIKTPFEWTVFCDAYKPRP